MHIITTRMVVISQRDVLQEVLKHSYTLTGIMPKVMIELSSRLSLKNDLGLDSLDIVTICQSFEKSYGIDFTDGDITDLKTAGDLANKVIVKRIKKHDNEQHTLQPN